MRKLNEVKRVPLIAAAVILFVFASVSVGCEEAMECKTIQRDGEEHYCCPSDQEEDKWVCQKEEEEEEVPDDWNHYPDHDCKHGYNYDTEECKENRCLHWARVNDKRTCTDWKYDREE